MCDWSQMKLTILNPPPPASPSEPPLPLEVVCPLVSEETSCPVLKVFVINPSGVGALKRNAHVFQDPLKPLTVFTR